ncbi:MAG TPA: hypothetical protein VNH11_00955, partial [Pirellulales bacterium]|nr:hypothetical protein [Pirellulales bacterium]
MRRVEAATIDFSQLPPLASGWAWSIPAEICSVVASGSTPAADKMFEREGDVPFIKVYNLTHRGFLDFSIRPTFVSAETHEKELKRSITRPGDVLINIVGPPLGKVSLVPNDFPEWNINQAVVLFRPHDGVCNRYLVNAFLSEAIMRRVTRLAKATAGQFNIGVGMCRQLLPVPIAPSNEQRRIVAKIDELFSDLDAGVAALERVNANLKRYRASVLKAAVEGRLTESWRAQYRPQETGEQLLQRILKERRRKWEEDQLAAFAVAGKQPPTNWQARYVEPATPDTTNLPTLPDGWCWATLEALSDLVGGITKDQKRAAERGICEVPYLRVANVQRGLLDLAEIKTIHASPADIRDLRLLVGDILFTEGGDRDKLGRGWVWGGQLPDCIHQNHIFRARLFSNEMQPEFISHHGNTFGRHWFTAAGKQTTNLASINLGILRRFPVPVAPSNEQAQIVSLVSERLSQIDAAEMEVEQSLLRAVRLRQSILRQAFAGKLVAQDPADEPAAALLARIQQSRAATTVIRTRGKQASDEFLRRAAIVSYTVNRLASQPSFGRTQLEKTLHLAQSHLGIDLGLEFERYAAGPFDKSLYRLEGVAKRSGWFTKHDRRRFGVTYHPGPKIDAMCQHAARLLGDKQAGFDRLLDQIATMNTDEAELFATAYAAWNDLLIDGRPA